MAGGAVEADGDGAVVDVLAAVVAGPAVDAHAGVAADGVEAGAAVVAGVGLHEALVDVLGAVLTWWRVQGCYFYCVVYFTLVDLSNNLQCKKSQKSNLN